jgi:hypothetical protein
MNIPASAMPRCWKNFTNVLVPDLPRIPYVEEASACTTVEAMQSLGPPLPKVDPKSLYDNGLLKGLEAKWFLNK